MADSYKRIAALMPADTDEAQLHECGANKKIQGIVSVCNQTDEPQRYSIAHCGLEHGDNPANPEDFRAKEVEIEPNSPPHEYSVNMTATETIRVKVEKANTINFILEGIEMT